MGFNRVFSVRLFTKVLGFLNLALIKFLVKKICSTFLKSIVLLDDDAKFEWWITKGCSDFKAM